MSETTWAKYLREKKRADKAQAEVERLRAESDALNRGLGAAVDEAERLRAELDEAKQPVRQVYEALSKARAEVERAQASLGEAGAEIERLRAELAEAKRIIRADLAKGPGQRVVHEYGDALDTLAKEERNEQ